jgi:hypothetical protein
MRVSYAFLVLITSGSGSYAQIALSLSSTTGAQGQTATLNVTSTSAAPTVAIQWTLITPPDIVSVKVVAGPSANAAGKMLSCNGKKCLVSGMNKNVIPDGVLAIIQLSVSSSATGTSQIQFSDVMGSSPSGSELIGSSSGGMVTISTPSAPVPPPPQPASLSAFTCADYVLRDGDSTVCTLSFTGPASSNGQALVNAQESLSAPSTIPVRAGASSVQFTVTAIDARGFDAMTASYGGVAITLSIKGHP